MLLGGILLLVADTLARVVAVPAEIPVGIFTALVGGPFFFLLVRQARSQVG
jgi:iron complex transport system permease protein